MGACALGLAAAAGCRSDATDPPPRSDAPSAVADSGVGGATSSARLVGDPEAPFEALLLHDGLARGSADEAAVLGFAEGLAERGFSVTLTGARESLVPVRDFDLYVLAGVAAGDASPSAIGAAVGSLPQTLSRAPVAILVVGDDAIPQLPGLVSAARRRGAFVVGAKAFSTSGSQTPRDDALRILAGDYGAQVAEGLLE